MRALLPLVVVCCLMPAADLVARPAGAAEALPTCRVLVDLYHPRTGELRQVVRYLAPPPGWQDGGYGVSPRPGVDEGAERTKALHLGFAVDQPGRSPQEVLRLAAGGRPSKVVGTWRALCLLVDFPDHQPTTHPGGAGRAHFDDLLFSQGTHATGSLYDYFNEVSYGNFGLEGDVAGWYRAPRTYAYYTDGSSGTGTYPHCTRKLVEDLVDRADRQVNYADYDNDLDGYVDALLVVHAGPGAEGLPAADRPNHIWSHKASISDRARDGVIISVYSIQGENTPMGTFAHEFSHVLGLPDLYDTDYSSRGVGVWSLMGSGNWLGNPAGTVPGHLDAWSRMRLGWLTPTAVKTGLDAEEVWPVEGTATAYSLWKDGSAGKEYFLLENRQREGFDRFLPGAGLCLWHVDEGRARFSNTQEWWPGRPNEEHYLVALEQADARWDLEHDLNRGDRGDRFPGRTEQRLFRHLGPHNSNAYSGAYTAVRVLNISDAAPATGVITADLRVVPGDLDPPTSLVITPEAPGDGDDLRVQPSGGADPGGGAVTYQVTWWKSTDGGRSYMRDLTANGATLGAAATTPWEMWLARVRSTNGKVFSDWAQSYPVSIIPATDICGQPLGTVWHLHQHPRPAHWTDQQWQNHLEGATGRRWSSAFHSPAEAARRARSRDLLLVGAGDYEPCYTPFKAITISGTAPQDPDQRAATRLARVVMSGPGCYVTGVTVPSLQLAGGAARVWRSNGALTWEPAAHADLTVQNHSGTVIAHLAPDKRAQVQVSDCVLDVLQVDQLHGDVAGAAITAADNSLSQLLRIEVQVSTAGSGAAIVCRRNTLMNAGLRVSLTRAAGSSASPGALTVVDNTLSGGHIDCQGRAEAPARGRVAGNWLDKPFAASPGTPGIFCSALAPLEVSGNEVAGAAGRGLVVEGCGGDTAPAEVFANTLRANSGGGLAVAGFEPTRVHDNQVRGNSNPGGQGGGLRLSGINLEVYNNEVRANSADYGGGIWSSAQVLDEGGTLVHDNRLIGNTALQEGGGLCLTPTVGSPRFYRNLIEANKGARGGGVWALKGELSGNTIVRNQATAAGGGLFLPWGYPAYGLATVSNNVIAANTAAAGGGVCVGDRVPAAAETAARLTNCTIANNTSAEGAGVLCQTATANHCQVYLSNCLITDNGAGGGLRFGAGDLVAQVTYCDVFGNAGGNYAGLADLTGSDGNLSVAPLYADAARRDYHLKSRVGRWSPAAARWVRDTVMSPCLDAGDPASPCALETAPNGGRINLGAYGNTPEASRSAAPAAGTETLVVTATVAPSGRALTPIAVSLSAAASVEVRILNLAGRLVAALPDRKLPAGVTVLLWDGKGRGGIALPAGAYLARVTARGDAGASACCLLRLSRH